MADDDQDSNGASVSGKVVHYDAHRGFGFLAPDSGGADVFLHINDIDIDEGLLKPGAEVSFDVEDTDRGAKAVNVTVTGEAPASAAPRGGGRRDEHRRDDHAGHRPARGPRRSGGGDAMDADDFTDELTELLLDSSDALTAGQIIAIRRRVVDFAIARGWVFD